MEIIKNTFSDGTFAPPDPHLWAFLEQIFSIIEYACKYAVNTVCTR